MKAKKLSDKITNHKSYLVGLSTGLLLAVLVLKLIPLLASNIQLASYSLPFNLKKLPTPTPDLAKQQEEITKMVLPEKVDLGVSFGEVVVNMVRLGAIDKEKFISLYEDREGLSKEEEELLDKPKDTSIIVTPQNAGLILNLLWPLGIVNKTQVLSDGPMGTTYKDRVGDFASTGGWTIGEQDGGELFNRFNILPLTPDQEELVKEIAENIYRPCCGNSTYFPDCNHGAAMLGFLELAVSSGMSKEEIYKKALVLNSYWFPQTYAELAIYFKTKKGISWDKVDAQEVLGANYSSGQGYVAINKQLQAEGLLPKVSGGGGCGV